MSIRQVILDTAADAGRDFAYYDRKEDEELSQEQLMDAVAAGVVTVEEIAETFGRAVRVSL